MTEEQITNRYVRGWISLADYRAEMVKFYDREDAKEARALIDFNTQVELYSGLIDWTEIHGAPEWTGTLGDFWHENEGAYHSFETFQEQLANPGFMYLGGGAEPEWTLAVVSLPVQS